MSLMPALPESIFDIAYLIFAIASGIALLLKAKDRKNKAQIALFGAMALTLGAGDAFHLVPRVLSYWLPQDFTIWLGIGKLVTSVTMTVFYLLLEYLRRKRFFIKRSQKNVLYLVWALCAVRIVLCCFPQNGWTSAEPSWLWGVLRNIPFALLGILTVILWFKTAREDRILKHMWLSVSLSFLFYLPVVLFSGQIPLLGMLMIPKTCMYIWMILMFRKAEKLSRL